ncbi:helix-turn-helix domain-containing protein [Fusibacter ferrireducens]|uniref:Helix-turn-helix transcriptional regulator n=1 Tax=Fusibacter ferrireducens TaxID=2785058 RepID=A0ABR9ZM09_9FIRM|nr:helix-turn-helix transcriptional regulator [Fusibacter ferrireducens]MBF4691490.1 helix-turn-helix transcriptional regulator [Fusibacter ferrireducens]
MKWNDAKQELLKNPELVEELEKNELEYQLISEFIQARLDLKMTQNDLAKLTGTKQSNISRFESGNYNPSLEFLEKVASALGKKIKIDLI